MKRTIILLIFIVTVICVKAQKEPPPPPPPPQPPTVVNTVPPPVVTVKGKQADEFYKRNPSVAHISRQGNIVTITLKEKAKEKYNLTRPSEASSFENKYGECPIPPPPPPPPPKLAIGC